MAEVTATRSKIVEWVESIGLRIDQSNVRTDIKQRKNIYRLLVSLLNRDRNPGEACLELCTNIMSESQNDRAGKAFRAWYAGMEKGASLSESMRGWIPDTELMQIRAGEEAGSVKGGIESALQVTYTQETIGKLLKDATFQPIVLIIIGYGILMMMANYMTPIVDEIVSGWPDASLPFKMFAEFVATYAIHITALLVISGVTIAMTMSSFSGPLRSSLDGVPPWSIHRRLSAAGFMRSFAGLLSRDRNPFGALTALSGASTPYVQWHIDAMISELQKHGRINDALISTRFFDDKQKIFLRITAGDGDFADNVSSMSNEQLNDVTEWVAQFARIFQLSAMIGIGSLLIWAFGSMGLAIMEFYNEVSTTS